MNEEATIFDTAGYAADLWARRTEGVKVPYRRVQIGSSVPQPNQCHGNAQIWVANNPKHRHVRGWLFFDLMRRFAAHSVVEDEDGQLIDITPTLAIDVYPFIRHVGDDQIFDWLVIENEVGNIDYPPSGDPELLKVYRSG